MNKKLTAKLQILAPNLGENEAQIANCITIEPSEKQTVLQKGSLYAAFDFHTKTSQNTSLVTKLAYDVLNETYYQSDNISPIQSLEKAIAALNEKLTNLQTQDAENATTLNLVAGVLWGNVFYMVQFGSGKSFLMRDGEIKEVSATSEGNFAVASGVVKSDDVVVLCTEAFAKKYPPEKLLSSAIAPNELGATHACIILKFMVDTEFTEEEVIDFNVTKETNTSKMSGILKKLKTTREEKKAKTQTIETLADIAPASSANIKVKSSLKPKVNVKKLIPIVLALLVISLVVNVLIKINKKNPGETAQTNTEQLTPPIEVRETTQPEKPTEPEEPLEEGTVATYITEEAFYDIKLADSQANPTDIVAFNNTVVSTDKTSGKIYTSLINTPKFEAEESTFIGIANALNFDGKLNFSDSEGYKVYNLTTSTLDNQYAQADLGLNSVYLDNIYDIKGDTLTKYVKSGSELEGSVWGTSESFNGATAIDIAYSIYVAAKNNEVVAFTQGVQSNFEVTGLPKPFGKIVDLETDVNFDNIYVADSANSRVVVISQDGEYVKEYLPRNKQLWADIKSISVSPDEGTLYVLSGSTVYQVELTTE